MTDRRSIPWAPVVALAALWGVAEAGLGMGLRQCAAAVSGTVMTGAALLFLAAGWAVARRAAALVAMAGIASAFKLFDALWLGLPVRHGAVANPMFAFWMETAAFLAIAAILRESLAAKDAGRAVHGAVAALLAVNLFPFVGYVTGIKACVAAGTTTPLSLYYAPFAVILSALTVPLGFRAGAAVRAAADRIAAAAPRARRWVSPAAAAAGLGAIVLLRLL